jgi:hypothetical protein
VVVTLPVLDALHCHGASRGAAKQAPTCSDVMCCTSCACPVVGMMAFKWLSTCRLQDQGAWWSDDMIGSGVRWRGWVFLICSKTAALISWRMPV